MTEKSVGGKKLNGIRRIMSLRPRFSRKCSCTLQVHRLGDRFFIFFFTYSNGNGLDVRISASFSYKKCSCYDAFNEYTFKYSCLIRNKSNFFPNNSACTLTTNLKSNIYALDTLIIICAYLMQHLEKYIHKNSNKNLTKKEEEK